MSNNEKRLPMLSWYIKVLNDKGVKVDILQLTFEAVELGKEEVDLSFLPKKDFNELPQTLLFETYAYEDVDGSYYFGYAILHPTTQVEWLGVIRKDDEAIGITYLPFSSKYKQQFLD